MNAGLSYMELVMALALFAIALATAFPAVSQAARNMRYAHFNYMAYQSANTMMLSVRDAIGDGGSIEIWQNVARNLAADNDVGYFSIWVSGGQSMEFHCNGSHTHALGASCITEAFGYASAPLPATFHANGFTVVVAIWCDDGHLMGRAVGLFGGV